MTPIHLGILQDLARRGSYDLDKWCSTWTQDQLIEIIMLDGPQLITISDDHVVRLTEAGKRVINAGHAPHLDVPPHLNLLDARGRGLDSGAAAQE